MELLNIMNQAIDEHGDDSNELVRIDDEVDELLRAGNKSDSTLEKYRSKIRQFKDWTANNPTDGISVIDQDGPHLVRMLVRYMHYYSSKVKYASIEQLRNAYVWFYRHELKWGNSWDARLKRGNPAMDDEVIILLKSYKIAMRDQITKRSKPLTYADLGKICNWVDAQNGKKLIQI